MRLRAAFSLSSLRVPASRVAKLDVVWLTSRHHKRRMKNGIAALASAWPQDPTADKLSDVPEFFILGMELLSLCEVHATSLQNDC